MSHECQQILKDLALYLDGECDPAVEHTITQHLTGCPPCMERSDFERTLRAMLARSCHERAPQAVLDRVRARLAKLA